MKKHKLKIVVAILFFSGMGFMLGLNSFFNYTNKTEFCISCHSMKQNHDEYKQTVHYKNTSGVRATCADCHVPKEFAPKFYAKIIAARDVYHQIIGTIDTPEKFEERRMYLAERVWTRMAETDSRECRTCHSYESMMIEDQDKLAGKKHKRASESGKTCIDCHQGIAHEEPG